MANDSSVNLMPGSPVEARAEAYRRLKKLRHKLFWVHPFGFIIAIVAAQGDTHKMRRYVVFAIIFSVVVQVAWVVQAISIRNAYGHQGVHHG